MEDLFSRPAGFEALPMIDAQLGFWPQFYPAARTADLMQRLLEETPWGQHTVTVWGREHQQPRLCAWYADAGIAYAYSGLTLSARDWTPTLLQVREEIEAACGERFNSVLLNLYRDGNDSMGWHSDDEAELGRNPAIASLSLGATRRFRLRHRSNAMQKPVALDLGDGSLLLMAGPTQHHWQHGIARQARPCGARINLTFRRIRTGAAAKEQP